MAEDVRPALTCEVEGSSGTSLLSDRQGGKETFAAIAIKATKIDADSWRATERPTLNHLCDRFSMVNGRPQPAFRVKMHRPRLPSTLRHSAVVRLQIFNPNLP